MTNRTSASIRVALFDVSGTLTTANTWGQLINHPSHDPSVRRRFQLWAYPTWFAMKFGFYSELKFRDGWIRGMARLLEGNSDAEVQDIFRWLIQVHTLPNLHKDVIAKVKSHKSQGHTVMFVSNMFADAVQMLADELDADKGLGTILEYKDEQATGSIASLPCAGPQKLEFVQNYFAQQGETLDLANEVIAYSDSWSDRHMLGGVAEAVATYPDKKLRKYAEDHRWAIMPLSE